MNSALRRQLRRLGLAEDVAPGDSETWQRLLDTVSSSYDDAERARYLQERALRISSAEMQELYERQRRVSESALRRERDLLRTVLDALEGALFSVDRDGTILFANRAAETLYDRPGHALVGVSLPENLVCDAAGTPDPFVRAVTFEETMRSASAHLQRPDGASIPVSVNIEPMSGDLNGSVVVLRDLSDARVMSQELLRAQAQLGNIVNAAPIPFFEEDFTQVGAWLAGLREQGIEDLEAHLRDNPSVLRQAASKIVIVSANPSAYTMLKVPQGESLVGPLDPRIISEESLAVITEQLLAIWNDQEMLTTEVDGLNRSGERLVANFHWAAHRVDGHLDLSKVVVALTDITQIVESEERMRELIKSKDHFLASVSHELRTPLTAVTAAAAVLDGEFEMLDDADRKELITMMSHESAEMAQIVEDLLVAARADMGSLTIISQVMPLEQEILEVAGRMASRGQRIRLGSISGWTFADPLRVRQIVRNLITNAVRYGGSDVWIDAWVEDNRAHIAVFDDGDGIPEESWESIFEPYQQAHTTPGLPGSVGMGLSVARHLVHLMSGEITYRYENGVSRFEVTLPAAAPPT